LNQIAGAMSKELLLRTEDVQVLHGFESEAEAKAYLSTKLFENDVVTALKPFLENNPEVRIYSSFKK
jgi:Holliday junction resolvase